MKIDDLAVMIKKQFDHMGFQFTIVKDKLDTLDVRMDAMESRMERVEERLNGIEKKVTFGEENHVVKMDHEDLAARVTKVESNLS